MPTLKTAGSSSTSRPSSARSSVISKAMAFNPTTQSSIGRQNSGDSLGESRSLRRKSVGPAVAKKPSSANSRRASSAASLNPRPVIAAAKDRVTVAVRKRPASGMEIDVVECPDLTSIQVSEPRKKVDLKEYTERHQFSFDYAFDENQDNEFVYRCTAQPLVPFVMQGGLATCFAFGQTGSGKTFTMLGAPEHDVPGLYLLASRDVFRALEDSPEDLDVFVSMMEIYGDDVFDLLSSNKQKLIPREDAKKKVQIQGLIERPVRDIEGMMDAIESGSTQRSTSVTGMNEASSRSHAILQIQIRTMSGKLHGQLSFIDLAGSEKGSDTAENVKKTRMEGAEINKSLLALKECIRAMTDPTAAYTPFRSSKLTQVLKESFIGNGRTVMIANISPSSASCLETVNTLRYADRVKAIGKAPPGTSRIPPPLSTSTNCSKLDMSVGNEVSFDEDVSNMSMNMSMNMRGGKDIGIKARTTVVPTGKENMGNKKVQPPSCVGMGTRRQSHIHEDRYASVLDTSVDDMEEDMRIRCEVSSHKRRRSPTGGASSITHTTTASLDTNQSKLAPSDEPSFTDEHDDEGFVYHGVQNDTILENERSSGEEDEDVAMETLDPVLFVNSFRHHIERSMVLIEKEVAMLDTLEKCGSNPLTPHNIQSVQSILMERISLASKLQAELQQHAKRR